MNRTGLAGAVCALVLAAGAAVAQSPCAQLSERELAGTEAAVTAFLEQDHAGFLDQVEGLRERDPDRYSAMLAELAAYRSAPYDSCEIMAVQRIS